METVKRLIENEFELKLEYDQELSFDSLGVVRIIVLIEEEYDVSFDEDVVRLGNFASIRKTSELVIDLMS